MGVRFVIGRAGTGKTRHCFDAIVAAMRADPLGPPIYWILPKQATFFAERDLTTLSGLRAFCRARVMSFELLGTEVLAACGGAAVAEVSSIGRQMLLGYLLRSRQDDLRFFRGVARQPGLAARLDSTFGEFERCGKDASALAELIDQLAPGDGEDAENPLLRDKLTDFHLLFKAYRDALGQERVDPHRRLEQVLTCISGYAELRSAAVYVDGFLDFTDRERRMIVALAKACPSLEITLPIEPTSPTLANVHHIPGDLSLFHRTESQYRLLKLALEESGVVIDAPLVLKTPRRFAEPALSSIEKYLFEPRYKPQPMTDALELVEAPDRRTEVDAAARRIRSALRGGLRLRDIAVLVRDIDDYEQLIAASFREHEIPYFVDRRRSAAHHPLLVFTRSLLLIARLNWPHEAVMALIKSGLAGLTPQEADALENYVLLHRIRGSAWTDRQDWTYSRNLTRGDGDGDNERTADLEPARMDALRRRVGDRVAPLVSLLRGSSATIREIVVAIFKLYDAFGVRETIEAWIDAADRANEPEQRGEHEQVWAELIRLFDQMVDLLGEQQVDLADFIEILDVGLEQFDLALTPPRVDQVLVGQVDRTRATSLDTVFLLGLCEGQFPRVTREDSVLSDTERRTLRQRNLDIDPDSQRRLLDENLLGYIGFTRASRRLIVSRATAQDNKPVNPSSFWTRLRRLFPQNHPTQEQREADAPPAAIGTPRQLVTALMRWARRNDRAVDAQQPWATLYQFLAQHETCDDAIGVMRYKAWRAVGYRNDARLSREVARELFPQELHASVTRIETFAACPFRHFARFALGLRPREEQDVTSMDLGNVYHNILERVVDRVLRQRKDWCELEPAISREMISGFADEVGRSIRGELMLSNARNKYLLNRIEKTLERVCATQRAVLSRGAFRPAYAELGFGTGNNVLPPLRLSTPKGHALLLHGKIDRVDHIDGGGEVAVIDYKMRGARLQLDQVYHGLSLQLLTYLLVLQASGQELFGKKVTPVAAFYAKLLRSCRAITHPDEALEADDPAFDLQTKPQGIFDARFLKQLDDSLDEGRSEVLRCHVKKGGTLADLNRSDAAGGEAFAALLRFVEKRITELADQLIDGKIAVMPYRIGLETPCSRCDFRSVCRFDPAINHYLTLPAMRRTDVLDLVTEGAPDGN